MNLASRRGSSLIEVLVVIGVIALLLGLLFPALGGLRQSGLMTKSMSNMRQIGSWMSLYSSENRDFVLPSQFNYNFDSGCGPNDGYDGKVRSEIMQRPTIGEAHAGTWADIIWTVYQLGSFPEAAQDPPDGLGYDLKYDSPDGFFYEWYAKNVGVEFHNPLRSAANNSRNTYGNPNNLATPYGPGASEALYPGYFAANNFFNADCEAKDVGTGNPAPQAAWYATGQIRAPERSMYLVDSPAGEVIQPWEVRYKRWDALMDELNEELHVDFRYGNVCLMLFLDGHIEIQEKWETLDDLEGPNSRGIRIRDLTSR